MRTRVTVAVVASALAIAGVAGSAVAFAGERDTAQRAATSAAEVATEGARTIDRGVLSTMPREKAAEIAVRFAGGGEPTGVEPHRVGDRTEYWVVLKTKSGHQVVVVDPRTGEARRDAAVERQLADHLKAADETERQVGRETPSRDLPPGVAVTKEQADRIAVRLVGGGEIDESGHTLDADRDAFIVTVVQGGKRHVVEVSVRTGEARKR